MSTWKACERRFALLLGGERVPVTGRVRGWAPDVEHPSYALEIKFRTRMPVLLREGMDQAVKAAMWARARGKGERLPMLIIHEKGRRYEDAIVCVRLKDAREWWGVGDGIPAEEVG